MRLLKTKSWFKRAAVIMVLIYIAPMVLGLLAAVVLPWLLQRFR